MRIPQAVAAAVVVLFAASAPAYAQVESTPIPTPAKPNFSSMAFMIGTWTCSTKSSRRPSAYVTTATYKMDPNGWYIDQTSVTKANGSWIPTTTTQYDKITYDPTTHRWADVDYGNEGEYSLSFASGWDGNKITWHDVSFAPSSDIKSQTDTVVTKVSPTKMTSSSTFTEAKTGRVVMVTGVCTKH